MTDLQERLAEAKRRRDIARLHFQQAAARFAEFPWADRGWLDECAHNLAARQRRVHAAEAALIDAGATA